MANTISVNLPVKDLSRSIAFFKSLGYNFNPQFTDETAACMVISETNFAMLLTHPKFKEFTPNPIADASKTTEVILALSLDSKDSAISMIKKALASGGKRYSEPKDYGFMFQDGFQDLDGHIWEYYYMDPKFVQPQ